MTCYRYAVQARGRSSRWRYRKAARGRRPAGSVTAFIERYRDRRLPAPIDADTLVRAGVTTKSLAPRTVHALKLLDLIDDKDQPTADLVALERVPSDQFKERFADILRTAYADVLKIADPAINDYERIRDQFQLYSPPSLRDRMATLFLGLAEYAEMIPEGRAKELTGRRPSTGKPRTLHPRLLGRRNHPRTVR